MPTTSSKTTDRAVSPAKHSSSTAAKAVTGRLVARKTKVMPPQPATARAKAVRAKPTAGADAVPKPKAKLVRDSFTMPRADFDLIDGLKERALAFKRPAKKSELLRAGLHALIALEDDRLHAALDALVPLKAGRPKKAG
jgi:hypothetical protein